MLVSENSLPEIAHPCITKRDAIKHAKNPLRIANLRGLKGFIIV
jgi:hypothetical protein